MESRSPERPGLFCFWETDENLMRSELSPTEMAEHLAKRKELWVERQTAQLAPIESKRTDGKGRRPEGFAAETAGATGINECTVNRAISRAGVKRKMGNLQWNSILKCFHRRTKTPSWVKRELLWAGKRTLILAIWKARFAR